MRLNLFLLAVLVGSCLGVVTTQHQARKRFVELEHDQAVEKQLEVEWGQLQLEQSTWSMHTRIEQIAAGYLQMRLPPRDRVRLVPAAPMPDSPPREKP